jgi:hypothetical protein
MVLITQMYSSLDDRKAMGLMFLGTNLAMSRRTGVSASSLRYRSLRILCARYWVWMAWQNNER